MGARKGPSQETLDKLEVAKRLIGEGKNIAAACREADIVPATYRRVVGITYPEKSRAQKGPKRGPYKKKNPAFVDLAPVDQPGLPVIVKKQNGTGPWIIVTPVNGIKGLLEELNQ